MDITALSLALRTADLGSFSAVARELDIAPSSVSRAVAAVEDRLGLRLFQRTSRTLSLTDEGEAYLRRVAPLIDQFEAARHEARAERARPTGIEIDLDIAVDLVDCGSIPEEAAATNVPCNWGYTEGFTGPGEG